MWDIVTSHTFTTPRTHPKPLGAPTTVKEIQPMQPSERVRLVYT